MELKRLAIIKVYLPLSKEIWLNIILDTGLLGTKPLNFRMEQNHQLGKAQGPLISNPISYHRLVGCLIYLTITWMDLAYSVQALAQFIHIPKHEHWDTTIRVLCYLKGTPRQGILLHSDSDLQLRAYCDSDWASYPITRRPLTGFFISLGLSPISWKFKK